LLHFLAIRITRSLAVCC